MELADLTRAEWEALLRALYQQEYRDREHGQSKSGLRRNEVLSWADELKGLHERLLEEFGSGSV